MLARRRINALHAMILLGSACVSDTLVFCRATLQGRQVLFVSDSPTTDVHFQFSFCFSVVQVERCPHCCDYWLITGEMRSQIGRSTILLSSLLLKRVVVEDGDR